MRKFPSYTQHDAMDWRYCLPKDDRGVVRTPVVIGYVAGKLHITHEGGSVGYQ